MHNVNLTGMETDYLGIKTNYDFYIGGTDSCQGKSKFEYCIQFIKRSLSFQSIAQPMNRSFSN